jgi:2'-5' RNA ligase
VNDERARLFVALELPEDVRSVLADWRTRVLHGHSGLRPVATEALHVTLCFLGWRAVSEVEAIAAAVCGSVGPHPPVELMLGEPAWLPARRPRVLAVSLEDRDRALPTVQSELAGSLQRGGWYVPESRPFFAHVTVARVGKGGRVPREPLDPPAPLELEASKVTLFRSRLSAAGARYQPLASVELGSSEPPTDPLSVVRRFHERQGRAYAGGPLEPLRELLSEEVVWHVPGRSLIAGEHRGVEAVLDYFDQRRRLTDESFRVTVHGMALIGERVVQLAGGRATRHGRDLEWETVGVFRVDAKGRIAECRLVPFDPGAFDEIWS